MKKLITITIVILLITIPAFAFDPGPDKREVTAEITWEQGMVDDLAGWNFYAKTDGEYVQIGTSEYAGTPQDTYTDEVLLYLDKNAEHDITFAMTAFDVDGIESEKSIPMTIGVDLLPPPVPGNITISVQVTVTVTP